METSYFESGTTVTVSFSNGKEAYNIIGEDARLNSMNIEMSNSDIEVCPLLFGKNIIKPLSREPIKITLEFLIPFDKYKIQMYEDLFSQVTIKDKKVDDCSIQELLFAIRKKIEEEKQNGKTKNNRYE